ncbi:MAG TPA: MFS transporter [Oscillospiraceae bacterium]|nr:MFS transporter [Oscillospiraceae bacterium]HPF55425.1 MFS transporter [Clostridiales bacterium]HPK34461.1 MFS transporter [Oscillospiraceae bacterium]HPR76287.1 MFS transporter [Oscillospiraceae bacterium]
MHSLDKRWKEFVYAASGFGPNIMMVFLMAYFTDAVYPVALSADKAQWSVAGYTLIFPAVWGLLWSLGRIFDGVVDIPLAHLTDNLRTKWGNRRPAIVVSFLPMMIAYLLMWIPLEFVENSVKNTIWIMIWGVLFFTTYTMCLLAFYGSLSTVCKDEPQRVRVSSYKAFFDTVGYSLVYALVPVFLGTGVNIRSVALYALPLMLTILIPVFMIKEGDKYGDTTKDTPKIPFWENLRIVLKNKSFIKWELVNCCVFFGLQIFLAAQNALISGWMGLGANYAAIMNTTAFAPVPLMLYFFYKIFRKKGMRFAVQTAFLLFAVSILGFIAGGKIFWPDNVTAQVVIGCIGGVMSSFSIGAFFAMPYIVPTQLAAVELELTGKNRSASYFAMQALFTSLAAAISTGVVYEYIKGLTADQLFGITAPAGEPFKLGLMFVPIIVCVTCLLGWALAFKMHKTYTKEIVAKELGVELPQKEHGN